MSTPQCSTKGIFNLLFQPRKNPSKNAKKKMNRLLFLIFVLSLITDAIFGQVNINKSINPVCYVIKGNVSDSSGKYPVEAASVMVNKRYSTTTDQNGNFILLFPIKYANKNFSILVASVGFAPLEIKIKNKHSIPAKELNVHLKAAIIDMNTPVIICCSN